MLRHEVAIYVPESVYWYERTGGWGGGAERQMMLLARALASRGIGVAHIVYPPSDVAQLPPGLTLVPREGDPGTRSLSGGVKEVARIWRSLGRANAEVTIVRRATPAVGIAALFSKLHRRKLVYSSASNFDFLPDRRGRYRSVSRMLYRLGVRLADVVVVQTEDQAGLARESFPRLREVVRIPSFCEPAGEAGDRIDGGSLLWIGRVLGSKAPLRYVELARTVPEGRFTMIANEHGASREHAEVREAARDVPNLELLDRIPHDQVMELVSRSVAVVSTSVPKAEGLPNVFLEAWARGVPVLSLDCDPDGVIERHELGIAADGSWDRFVEGARELLNGRDRRAELGRRARAYVQEVHSVDAVADSWAELVERLGRGGG
jgi:glycosyltransferase involved in cell wall biosynthesis